MRKSVKSVALTGFTSITSIVVLLLLFSYVNHKIQLSKEELLIVPTGHLVKVNGHEMHIHTEGKGEDTLVFMSGGGTSAPALDFKSLYSLLKDQFNIAVVEKAGYGFSESSKAERDVDTILSETREALLKAGVKGPYVLVPHSMSGIEALRWSQSYPEEVKAIIGLDMAVPAAYDDFNMNMQLVRLGSFAARIGITRWIPGLSESDAMKYGTLTKEEKQLYRAIFYRKTSTQDMINEMKHIKANAQKVGKAGKPDVPLLLFSSNGKGTGFDEKKWVEAQADFARGSDQGKLVKLDASHYVHNIEFERIAEEIKVFLEKLK